MGACARREREREVRPVKRARVIGSWVLLGAWVVSGCSFLYEAESTTDRGEADAADLDANGTGQDGAEPDEDATLEDENLVSAACASDGACDEGQWCCSGTCVTAVPGGCCSDAHCGSPPGQCFEASGHCQDRLCTYAPLSAGACDDHNGCTTGDHCLEGNCVGTPIQCPPLAPTCNATDDALVLAAVSCDPSTGVCSQQQTREVSCPSCTVNCLGACESLRCEQFDTECSESRCSSSSGRVMCEAQNRVNGTPCASGVCASGQCSQCVTEADCPDPAGECVVPRCEGGSCSTSALSGVACGDGMICSGGQCVECRSDADCEAPRSRCNPATNTCVECLGPADCGASECELAGCVGGECQIGDAPDGSPCGESRPYTCANGTTTTAQCEVCRSGSCVANSDLYNDRCEPVCWFVGYLCNSPWNVRACRLDSPCPYGYVGDGFANANSARCCVGVNGINCCDGEANGCQQPR